MGVLINMKMPESCWTCPFCMDFDFLDPYECAACMHDFEDGIDMYENSRPDWCPLTEIPEPHGKLVDADALIEYCKHYAEMFKGSSLKTDKARRDELMSVIGEIINAPTIIPATEESVE